MDAEKCWDCAEVSVGKCELCGRPYCEWHGGAHRLCSSCALDLRVLSPNGVWALGVLSLCVGGLVLAMGIPELLRGDSIPDGMAITLVVLLGVLPVAVGWGLIRGQGWARKATMVLSAPWALAFPVGTLAVYGVFSHLKSKWVRMWFEARSSPTARQRFHQTKSDLIARAESLNSVVEETISKYAQERQFEVHLFGERLYDKIGWSWCLWKPEHDFTYKYYAWLDVDLGAILLGNAVPPTEVVFRLWRYSYRGLRQAPDDNPGLSMESVGVHSIRTTALSPASLLEGLVGLEQIPETAQPHRLRLSAGRPPASSRA